MPSSTSGSKTAALRYIGVLVGICGVAIILLELSSQYVLKHYSATYARISQQYKEAVTVRPSRHGQAPCVLMVGNSLLLHGVKLDRLRALTSARMQVYPIFLEATGYYDWFYALRQLFREGAKPDVVVVGVGVNYFLSKSVRQDYAPMLFFSARDTLAVAEELQMDRTATSNLLLAHSSTFWDTRSAVRLQILSHMVPHLEDLFSLVSPRPGIPAGPEFEEITIARLQKLRQLCDAEGAKLIVLLPPTLSSESATSEMARAGRIAGVDISVPLDPAGVSAQFYQPDGMHLNPAGAGLFTSALAKDLPERIVARNILASSVVR